MRNAVILIADLVPSSSLGATLNETLKLDLFPIHRIQPESMGADLSSSLSKALNRTPPALVFLVVGSSSFEAASRATVHLREIRPDVPIVAVVEGADPDRLLELLKLGIADFITPPLKALNILPRIWRLLEHYQNAPSHLTAMKELHGLKKIIGESPGFLAEVKKFPVIAKCDASVLILGETGTGKELCARAIHYLSPRATQSFVPVNCGAIPVDLVENELFGHEREAFTGAHSSRPGLIQEAHGGTLFLDEIDCLPLGAQVKLLRFLQEKEYRPLGSIKVRKADVRVIAATNVDLQEAVSSQRIRQDLYYRINIIPVTLPPLRERRGDIPLLARHFLEKYATSFAKPATAFSNGALHKLMVYDWPGNVRELENAIERAVVMSDREMIQSESIGLPGSSIERRASFQQMKAQVIEKFEKDYLSGLMLAHEGNVTRAAQAAGKDRRALRQLIRKHKIQAHEFRRT
jgi:two-component system, NtrC family, response regulator GlrR